MHTEKDGINLWYGTSDAPAPQKSISSNVEIPLTIGVKPADASNRVEVHFRVNNGQIETLSTRWLRNDEVNKAQYFRAQFPNFRAGDIVEYGVVCFCAGRMVPSEEEAGRLPVSFHVGNGEEMSASSVQPLSELKVSTSPLSLGKPPVIAPSFAPILPEAPTVSATAIRPALTSTVVAETKTVETSRSVPPPLPLIPLHELTSLVPHLSPDLVASLKVGNIHSLADIRSVGGLRHLEALKTIKDHPATARLEDHAQLSLLSPDTAIREKLIERGFNNLFNIARADRAEFVEKNHDVLGDLGAARLHAKARAQAAVANNAIVEAKVNAANGWTVTGGDLVTTTSRLIGTRSLEKIFKVYCKECKDCESAVSPLAYLADLIMYLKTNLLYKDNNNKVSAVEYSFLETTFHQKFGSLPASCELMDARLRQVRIAIEVLREYKKSKTPTSASSEEERKALRDIYHTLLIKIGTSYAELRLAQTASAKEKDELAEKLGLSNPTATEDHLKDLLLDKVTLSSTTLLEQKLEELFGFASTQKDSLAPRPVPMLLEWRRKHLRELWKDQDFPDDMPGEVYPLPDGTPSNRYPIIDPDVIGPDDFRSPDATHTAFILWLQRRQWIDGELNNFKTQKGTGTVTTPDTERILDLMVSGRGYPSSTSPTTTAKWMVIDPTYTDPKKELSALHQDLTSGHLNKEQVNQLLIKLNEHFGLGADGLNRLMGIWEKDIATWLDPHNPKVEDEEWNDVCNILTQALKRLLFTKWLEEEKNKKIEFCPNEFWIALTEPAEGEWPPVHIATDPWIDPDLLKFTDLPDSTVGVAARAFYETRKTELETIRTGLETTRKDPAKGFNSMLKEALGNPLPVDVDQTEIDLASKDATISGPAENNVRTKLYMTVETFQQLMTIRAKDNQTVIALKPTTAEYEEAYNILTSAYKLRVMYPKWLTQEPGMEYWRALKARLPHWRASAEARADWQQKLRLRMRPPIIDPDLLAKLYFQHPVHIKQYWSIRSTEIENKLADLANKKKAAASGKELDVILVDTLGISESALLAIDNDREVGKDITARIAQLNLSNEAFNDLVRMSHLITAKAMIEDEEWDAVYSILTEVWKDRNKIVEWHEEEKAKSIVLGPDEFRIPDTDQRLLLPDLPAWRATYIARLDWEDNLQARIDQDTALEDSLRAAVDATEEITLPPLRDVLIDEAPDVTGSTLERAKQLSNCFLIEMRDNGCAKTTRISQAIETLQNLLFSVRTGQFHDKKFTLKVETPATIEEALAIFDEDWVWMGSYSAWRAAIFVILYTENILLPSLRKKQTPVFRELVKGLRTIGQVTPERARQAAQKYSEYFRDVCSLELQATVIAEVPLFAIEDLRPADVTKGAKNKFGGLPRLFLFARSKVSGKVYWCTRDGGSQDAKTQTFWREISISSLGSAEKLIGATQYWLTDAENNVYERYIYLFAQVHDGRNYKLVFYRYDLTYARWIEEQNELELPNKATSFKGVRLLLQGKADQPLEPDPYKAPQLEITLQDDKSYIGSLAEEGKDWASLESTIQVIKFAEWTSAQLNVGDKCPKDESKFTAQNIADWIRAAHYAAKNNGFVGGFPNFHMADNNYGVVQLTADAAVAIPQFYIAQDKSSIDGIKNTFKAVHEEAVKHQWASGFPTFDDQNTVVWIKSGVATQAGLGGQNRKVETACDFALSFTDVADVIAKSNASYLAGGFPIFTGSVSGQDWGVVYVRKEQTVEPSKRPSVNIASVGKIKPTYNDNGPFDVTSPRLDPNREKIKITYEDKDNQTAPQSILTYLDEAWYFVPIHISLQLQRSGYYTEALDWFKTVYDYTADKTVRKIFYGLVKEETSSKDYDRADDWLRDPLDPHGIAASRYNVYTRFTLLSIIRCLIDYADAEFTRDTSESVPLARTLYKTAIELLDADELKQSLNGCDQIIGELEIKYGEEIVKEIGLGKIGNVATLEMVSGSVSSIMDSSAPLAQKVEAARALVDNALVAEGHSQMTIGASIEEGEKQAGEMALVIMSGAGVVDKMNFVASNAANAFDFAMNTYTEKVIGDTEKISLSFLRTSSPEPTTGNDRLNFAATEFMSGVRATRDGTVGLTPSGDNPPRDNFPTDPRLNVIPGSELAKMVIPEGPIGTVKVSSSRTVTVPGKGWSWSWTIPALIFSGCIPPNPILKALRMRAELNLMKSWTCRNIAGVRRELEPYAAPTDMFSGMPVVGAGGQLVLPGVGSYRPTPYRYTTLIERAKQLVQLAQQVESSMFSAFQQRDTEAYNMLKARQDIETARANVTLQNLRKTEADAGVTLATLQRDRASIQFNHYQGLISADINGEERAALVLMWSTAGLYTFASVASLRKAGSPDWAQASSSAAQATSTIASALSTIASYERRKEEWEFERLLASQDIQIGNQQIQIANDHVGVVKQEVEIAQLQTQHAEDGAKFLANKFTNTELYEWMSGVLEGVYRYFLQQATSMAKLASDQLAFERQETPPAFIQSDYWGPPNEDNFGAGQGKGPERHGLSGSARLLQDIYQLDQYAFESNKRKLQLSKIISLAAIAPVEFQQFRETGVMTFATPMEMFDRDFPGHYLRLIRRIKTSVVALIPPGLGIKATLTPSRSTRAVIGGDIFQTVRVQHGPDVIALTSPRDATGVFEMDTQPEMQAPFENIGVDAFWEFRMPKASNLFDFNTIADVLLTIEYTALNSFDYRDQVIQNLRPRVSADRAFSFRLDFADEWYDLHNPELEAQEDQMVAVFETGRQDFPPNLQSLKIQQVVLYYARKDGSMFEIPVISLRFTEQGTPGGVGGAATSIDGVISTRRGNASSWMSMIGKSPFGKWVLTLPNTAEIKNRFKKEEIEDILFVITYAGRTPDWPA